MNTARKIISSVHKALKPLVEEHWIRRGEKYDSVKTIRGWQGGDWSDGYRMTIDKWNKNVRLEYRMRGKPEIDRYTKLVDALRTAGLTFKILNYYPYRKPMIFEKPDVTERDDYLLIPYEDN